MACPEYHRDLYRFILALGVNDPDGALDQLGVALRFSVRTADRTPITLDSMYCIPVTLSPVVLPLVVPAGLGNVTPGGQGAVSARTGWTAGRRET